MLRKLLNKLENPKRPLLGPNIKALQFWGVLLPRSKFKRYFYIIMHICVTLFTASEYVDIWFIKDNIDLVLDNAKITLLATMSVCKINTFLFLQQHWISIIDYVTRADLMQRTSNDSVKKDIISKYTKYSRKITYLYWSLMYTTVIIVMFQPMLKYSLSQTYRENVKNGTETYLQVVSSWVPFDKNTIPGYLGASIIQTYASIYGGGWITSFDTNAVVIMVFFRAELEMLRIDSSRIFDDVEKNTEKAFERMKECYRRHVELVKFYDFECSDTPAEGSSQSVQQNALAVYFDATGFSADVSGHSKSIVSVLSQMFHVEPKEFARLFDSCLWPIMLLYMFVCSVMLCVTAYQITMQKSAMERFLTTEYLVFGIAQLFIYCWHSNDVLYASRQLTSGPYHSSWWIKGPKIRKDLHILTGQFSTVIAFSAGPFSKLTIPTFINILKGAYSYYTLLSQSQMK